MTGCSNSTIVIDGVTYSQINNSYCVSDYDDNMNPIIESLPPEIVKKDISIYSIFDIVDVHQNVLRDHNYYEVKQFTMYGTTQNSL